MCKKGVEDPDKLKVRRGCALESECLAMPVKHVPSSLVLLFRECICTIRVASSHVDCKKIDRESQLFFELAVLTSQYATIVHVCLTVMFAERHIRLGGPAPLALPRRARLASHCPQITLVYEGSLPRPRKSVLHDTDQKGGSRFQFSVRALLGLRDILAEMQK